MVHEQSDYIVLNDVTFRGANGPIFAHTTWRWVPGERWAIRGASGSGKSLFVSAIIGRLPRLSGTLRHPFLEGQLHCADTIYGVSPRGTIAVASMEQHRALLAARDFHQMRWHGSLSATALRVAEYLSWAAVAKLSPFVIDEQAYQAIARFEDCRRREIARWQLEPLLERPLLALSNGELHRLLVARALMLEPRLLIVDDPYAGLDAHTRVRLTENLSELEDQGTAVLYVAARDQDVPVTVSHELELDSGAVSYVGRRRASDRRKSLVVHAESAIAPTRLSLPEVVIELRDVSVKQGLVTLLDQVTLVVYAGERWALVGPNGAGKSTLLSLVLADNPQIHSNYVRICGRQMGPGTSIWDIKQNVGWVSPELEAHYPVATPIVDVVLSGFRSSLGVHEALGAEQREAADMWLGRVDLTAYRQKSLEDLRRRDRRLALLARACVHRPKILLLDEPCQGLDEPDRLHFVATLEHCLSVLGAAMVYVTHETAELPSTVDHWLEIEAGRVIQQHGRAE